MYGNCSGHGVCSASVKGCRCDVGWTGNLCQARQNLCQLGGIKTSCNGRGQCNEDTGICICDEMWYGDQCQLKRCSGHGLYDIELNECVCKAGYAGDDCSVCEPPTQGLAFLCVEKYNVLPSGMFVKEDGSVTIVGNGRGSSLQQQQQQLMLEGGAEWGKNIKDAKSLSKEALESIVQPVLDKKNNPVIDFKRIAVEENEIAINLMGISKLARMIPGIMILPGTTVNGTTYGCDCRPATPVDEGEIYDVVTNPSNNDNENENEDPKSVVDMEKDAYEKIWGKKDEKSKDSVDTNKAGYNSLTIVRQKQREEELARPIFNEDQRARYGAYTDDMKLIAHGRFFTKFVERRNPLDGLYAKSQQQELVNMYRQEIIENRNDPEFVGIVLRASSSSNTSGNSAVTTTVVVVSVLASILITMLGTACIFISKRNFEENA